MKRMTTILALTLFLAAASTAGAISGAGVGVFTDKAGYEIRLVGGVFRNTGNGWYQIQHGHESLGLGRPWCNQRNGFLVLPVQPAASMVITSWANPDETLSRRGIIAGSSVRGRSINVRFTQITTRGPRTLHCSSAILQGEGANVWIGGVFR